MRRTTGGLFAVAALCSCLALVGCGGESGNSTGDSKITEDTAIVESSIESNEIAAKIGRYSHIPDSVMDATLRGYLPYFDIPFGESGLDEANAGTVGTEFSVGSAKFLDKEVKVVFWYEHLKTGDENLTTIELKWPEEYSLDEIGAKLTSLLDCDYSQKESTYITVPLPDTKLQINILDYSTFGSSIYIEPSDENAPAKSDDPLSSIESYSDIPDELMNDKFKKALTLLDKSFNKSGFSKSDGEDTGAGTYVFDLPGCKFLGEGFGDSQGAPRIVYSTKGVKSGKGTGEEISFNYYNALKSNGYRETVDLIDDISDALDVDIEIENDYNSSTKLAGGTYCTVVFPNISLQMEVKNRTGYVQVVLSKTGD